MTSTHLSWLMTQAFILRACISVLVMKLISLLVNASSTRTEQLGSDMLFFMGLPLPAIPLMADLKQVEPHSWRRALTEFAMTFFFFAVVAAWFPIHHWVVAFLGLSGESLSSRWILGYLALPLALSVGEVLNGILRLLYLPSGWLLPPIHCFPPASERVSEFWGRRWNTWVGAWFRQVLQPIFGKKSAWGLVFIFFVSGLWHEWLINQPFTDLSGQRFYGWMTLYFIIQAGAIAFDRRFLSNRPRLARTLCWFAVLAPSPLVFNEACLRILHLWPN